MQSFSRRSSWTTVDTSGNLLGMYLLGIYPGQLDAKPSSRAHPPELLEALQMILRLSSDKKLSFVCSVIAMFQDRSAVASIGLLTQMPLGYLSGAEMTLSSF